MRLRPYQEDIIERTRQAFRDGYKRPLVVLPCGAGKTICFSYMAHEHVKRGGRVWFLVHRKELLDQAKSVVGNNPNIYIGMVGSIECDFKPTLIIFDEAHHSTARTWQQIISENDCLIIGLTATPCRLDGTSLGGVYDTLIVGVEAHELIKSGYLADYDYYAPANLISDFTSDTQNDDFYFEPRIYGDACKYVSDHTIIYCPNIKFSQALAEYIPGAVHFDGNTPKKERDLIIQEFRDGKIRCLLNVDLIGEGFDVPDCDTVILLRPTMSTALFIQQSMRCMRPKPNKRAKIYDLVGNVFRHGMPTDVREWTLTGRITPRNRSAEPDIITRQCSKCYRVYSGTNPICPYCHNDNGKIKKQIEIEKQQELAVITEINKKSARREVGMCKTLNELIELGKKRGYKNPFYWAQMVMRGRNGRNI